MTKVRNRFGNDEEQRVKDIDAGFAELSRIWFNKRIDENVNVNVAQYLNKKLPRPTPKISKSCQNHSKKLSVEV